MSLVDDLLMVQVVIYTSLVLKVMYSYIALAISPICYLGAVHKNYSDPQIHRQYDQTNWVCVRVTTTTFNAIHIFFLFVKHVEKVFKHKQLEVQLAEAKLAQQNLQFEEDKRKTLAENQLVWQS